MATPRILTTSHGSNREAFAPLDWGLFTSLSLIWGASFLFMAIGLDAFHPGLVTWLRVGFGAAVMALIPRARKTKIGSQDRSRVGILGLVWIALPLTLFPIAQLWIDSAVAGMLNGATPVFTALLATILLRALPGRLQMAGLAVGFAGIVAIALPSTGSGTTATIGVIMVLVATVAYMAMTPEERERFKEAEKEHLRALKKLKEAARQTRRRASVNQALANMAGALGQEDSLDVHDEMLDKLALDTARKEARMEIALENAALKESIHEEDDSSSNSVHEEDDDSDHEEDDDSGYKTK